MDTCSKSPCAVPLGCNTRNTLHCRDLYKTSLPITFKIGREVELVKGSKLHHPAWIWQSASEISASANLNPQGVAFVKPFADPHVEIDT